MLKSAQKATRGEGGFTLIELLVVMIIIAILMAVAVPTFLKQKQNAVATKAKANIKQVQNAIESCASGNISGEITAPAPGRDCTSVANIEADEPSLAAVLSAAPASEAITIAPVNTMGYNISSAYVGEGGVAGTFVLDNDGNGGITKTCTPNPSKACPTGVW